MRHRFVVPAAAGLLAAGLLPAAPAQASALGLAISVPSAVTLGTYPLSGSFTADLGSITVSTSSLLLSDASWTATVTASRFTTGRGSPAETLPASAVSYLSGPATSQSGLSLDAILPGSPSTALPLATSRVAFGYSGVAILGGTWLTWRPRLVITPGTSAVAGTYTGTITHSVA